MLIDREWTERENRRVTRRIKEARLGSQASLEDVVCDPARGLDKTAIRQLATCQWVRAKQNVIVIGPTGIGKTYLAAALATGACRKGLRALFLRVPRLVEELAVARVSGTYAQTLARIGKIDVLVLDDLLLTPMKDAERRDLLEVLEDRYDRCSTVITSQLPAKIGTKPLEIRRIGHHAKLRAGDLVRIEPDLLAYFGSAEAVNKALRDVAERRGR